MRQCTAAASSRPHLDAHLVVEMLSCISNQIEETCAVRNQPKPLESRTFNLDAVLLVFDSQGSSGLENWRTGELGTGELENWFPAAAAAIPVTTASIQFQY